MTVVALTFPVDIDVTVAPARRAEQSSHDLEWQLGCALALILEEVAPEVLAGGLAGVEAKLSRGNTPKRMVLMNDPLYTLTPERRETSGPGVVEAVEAGMP
ncbi:hypothetical protein [Deinococcus hopiensis]|uniref:Uncharacterized protein n=1 Tax=Deinococcus hopiensis KR-140 TaxID=695939 RepID=A0A1W1VWZ7_9DEIO|nr:hypothetical protein [Deinococcus hopiensis]SMB97414.1 hypothetical protein SAMN00790413_05933 [Deinococcus hopiensis KR-140]